MPGDPDQAARPATKAPARRQLGELVRRAVSAALLGGTALAALWWGSPVFVLLVMAIGIVMSWEWGRVVRGQDFDATFGVHALGILVSVGLAGFGMTGLAFAALMVAAAAVFARQLGARPWLSAMGLAYVGLPAIALVWLRAEPVHGFAAVSFIFATVWAHDTFAMLVGKAVGGPRLWPALSPNKTWAGMAGGLAATAMIGWAANVLLAAQAPIGLALVGLVLGLATFCGDLLESALKRRYGIKNASDLIPGHGGFMDRMDGLVTAAIAAVCLALLLNFDSPAAGLLLLQ